MAIPVALRRRLEPCNVPRSVNGSLYKSDHSQKIGGFILSQVSRYNRDRFGGRGVPAQACLQAATLRPTWQRCPRPKTLKRTQATMLRPLPGGTTKVALPDPPRAKLAQ